MRLLAVAALLAACDGPPPRTYAASPGTPAALYVVVREELAGTKSARRLEIATRGAFADDGSLRVEIVRASLESREDDGKTSVVATDVVAADPSRRSAADAAATRLLEGLRAASVRIGFDPEKGVTSVEGLDRALDAAARGDESIDRKSVV